MRFVSLMTDTWRVKRCIIIIIIIICNPVVMSVALSVCDSVCDNPRIPGTAEPGDFKFCTHIEG